MSKEPTRHQLSSRLAYQSRTPAFLLKLQQRVSGARDDDDDDEFEYDGSGRPPIPKRPAIPQRPDDDLGSADEDDGDEKPQVVVLKEGKHLSEREVENERRKAKGLPPLVDPETKDSGVDNKQKDKANNPAAKQAQGLSFCSSSSGALAKGKAAKRKVVGDGRDDDLVAAATLNPNKGSKKKAKRAEKKLLSFGEDA